MLLPMQVAFIFFNYLDPISIFNWKFVVIIILLGFPIALIFSWVFDKTQLMQFEKKLQASKPFYLDRPAFRFVSISFRFEVYNPRLMINP